MNAEQFRQSAETDQGLADYLDEIAQSASPAETDRSMGLDILFVTAGYALYLWVRNYLDHKRGLQEAELRRLMEAEIEKLVKKGHSREEALSAVLAVSKAVASTPPDDSVLKAGLALLKQ
jgi:hypothetical protein